MSNIRISEEFTSSSTDFIRVAPLEELKTAGLIVVRGALCPLLVVYDDGKVFALDNRCPHLGFPLHRGSVATRQVKTSVAPMTGQYAVFPTPAMLTVTPTGATVRGVGA
jgi:hypothetical protein